MSQDAYVFDNIKCVPPKGVISIVFLLKYDMSVWQGKEPGMGKGLTGP